MKYKCVRCDELATWCYMPGFSGREAKDAYLCNKCVPRGCTCTDDPDEPCCEFWYDEDGYEIENTDN